MAASDYIPALIPEEQRPSPPTKLSGKELLQRTTINSILPAHDAYFIPSDNSALQALHLLTNKHILALPVYDTRNRQFTSFIDMLDISTHITSHDPETLKGELERTTCGSLVDASTRNPYRAIEDRASLDAALQLILNGKLHRLAVLDAEGRFDNILTQSTLVRFINDHIGAFRFASERIGDLQLGYQSVVTVPDTVTAREAFNAIKDSQVSAVGVVNSEGIMVEVISISDLRILLQQRTAQDPFPVALLDENVLEYLNKRVHLSEALRVARGLVCVTPAATVEEVLFKLVATRVHRAYVVHELKPIGVIALYDILKLASEEA